MKRRTVLKWFMKSETLWEGPHIEKGENHSEEGAAETSPALCALPREKEVEDLGMCRCKAEPGKKVGMEERYF